VGVLELNRNPDNYFSEVEQAAFAPSRIVDGIGHSPDKMLQGRILAYPDAQRYRLGTNYEQIPVNRCPFMVNNYQRDGLMRVDDNGRRSANYFPNSFDDIEPNQSYKRPAEPLAFPAADWYDRNAEGENDHYTQPGIFFREVLADEDKQSLISNIAESMLGIDGPKKEDIINRQLCHFFRADINLGIGVTKALGVSTEVISGHMPKA
jgi:catalase